MPRDKARILMLDSDSSALEFVQDLASLYNYELHCCTCVEEAFELLNQVELDALLVNTGDSGAGFLFIQTIRTLVDCDDTPVLFITNQPADAITMMEAQFYGGLFLHQKPFNEAELLAQMTTMVRIKFLQDELKERMSELDRLASTDVLTGLYNRRMFFIRFEEELARSCRNSSSLCLIYIDIDHFKLTNDTYGHQAGDLILQHLSAVMAEQIRRNDVLGRIGGEEFALLLPDAQTGQGKIVAERLRMAAESQPVKYGEKVITTTISLGVYNIVDTSGTTIDSIIREADEALYDAKRAGRNRVKVRHQ